MSDVRKFRRQIFRWKSKSIERESNFVDRKQYQLLPISQRPEERLDRCPTGVSLFHYEFNFNY